MRTLRWSSSRCSVLIDFARLKAGGDGLTPVQMAVSIYLDAINIFLALLQIFGGRRSNN